MLDRLSGLRQLFRKQNRKGRISDFWAERNHYSYTGRKRIPKEEDIMAYPVESIASWFLEQETMTHKKVQKLCYYARPGAMPCMTGR